MAKMTLFCALTCGSVAHVHSFIFCTFINQVTYKQLLMEIKTKTTEFARPI